MILEREEYFEYRWLTIWFLAQRRSFWIDIETIELMWKDDRYAKNVDRIFNCFSNKMNDCNSRCWWKFEWLSDSILRLSSRQKKKIVLLWSIDMSSSWFSSKNDDSSNDVEDLISDSNIAQMFDMMFSWWSKSDLMT